MGILAVPDSWLVEEEEDTDDVDEARGAMVNQEGVDGCPLVSSGVSERSVKGMLTVPDPWLIEKEAEYIDDVGEVWGAMDSMCGALGAIADNEDVEACPWGLSGVWERRKGRRRRTMSIWLYGSLRLLPVVGTGPASSSKTWVRQRGLLPLE
jgi:hypothetical protein